MTIARPRCTNTSQGASWFTTTTAPSAPSAAIATSEAVASHATRGRRFRNTIQAVITVAISNTPVIVPTVRCEYSMIECTFGGGYGRPLHSGQSGHPRPEPETRTTPPSAIWR